MVLSVFLTVWWRCWLTLIGIHMLLFFLDNSNLGHKIILAMDIFRFAFIFFVFLKFTNFNWKTFDFQICLFQSPSSFFLSAWNFEKLLLIRDNRTHLTIGFLNRWIVYIRISTSCLTILRMLSALLRSVFEIVKNFVSIWLWRCRVSWTLIPKWLWLIHLRVAHVFSGYSWRWTCIYRWLVGILLQ